MEPQLNKYVGKWVAIAHGKILSANEDPEKVVAEVGKNYPQEKPIFHRVTDVNELWAI